MRVRWVVGNRLEVRGGHDGRRVGGNGCAYDGRFEMTMEESIGMRKG